MLNLKKLLEEIDPRSFEHLHEDSKRLFGFARYFHEGVHFNISKPAGNALQLSHTIALTTTRTPNYSFTACYSKPQGPNSPVVVASMDTFGNLTCAAVIKSPSNKLKLIGQTEGIKWMGAQLEVQHFFEKSAATLKLTNVNPLTTSGLAVVSYLQTVAPHVQLGGELKCDVSEGGVIAVPSFGGRYRTETFCFASKISHRGILEASCMREVSPRVSVAADLDVNLLRGEALARMTCVYKFRESLIYTQINSSGVVAAVLQRDLGTPNIKFSLSGMMNHYTGTSAFGMGFNAQF